MKLATLCYVIDKKKNRTLMLHRVKKVNDVHEGKWNGLGGKLEIGETPEECVIREIKEESGLSISDPRLHGFITFPLFDGVDDWYVFVFTAENYSGEIIESAEGNLEWIPSESVTALNLWDGDAIFLKWLKEDKFFSAKFIYEKGMLKNHSVTFY
ncbi:MAG TPA: 8-oxo-dGTP diphosphatase [Ignavibacteriaceae bacterium]|nr:8-oxo-dGTP diphosphatase [Ignavibacteriaceae bacterium]